MSFWKFLDDVMSGIDMGERAVRSIEAYGNARICTACRVVPALDDSRFCRFCRRMTSHSAIADDGTVIDVDYVVRKLNDVEPKDDAERQAIDRLRHRFGAMLDAKKGGRDDA